MRQAGAAAAARWLVWIGIAVAALTGPYVSAGDGNDVIGNDDLARIRLEIVGQEPRDAGALTEVPAPRSGATGPPRLEIGRLSRDAGGRLVLPIAIRVPGGGIAGFEEAEQNIRFEVDGAGEAALAGQDPATLLQDVRISEDGGTVRVLLGVPAGGLAGIESMTIAGTFRLSRASSRVRATSAPAGIRVGQEDRVGPFRYRFERILPESARTRSVWVRIDPDGAGAVDVLSVRLLNSEHPDERDRIRSARLGREGLDTVFVLDRTVRSAQVEIEYLRAPSRLDVPFRIAVRRSAVPSLDGLWQLRTASGFVSSVRLTRLEDGRYRFPGSTRFSGTYELRDDALVCVRPYHRRLRGFVWRVEDDRRLVLVDQPDPARVGGTYLGSLMRR